MSAPENAYVAPTTGFRGRPSTRPVVVNDLDARRLLFVVNNPDFFLSHRLPIALAAAERGYSVHVATPMGDSVSTILEHGFVHHVIPLTRSSSRAREETRAVAGIASLFRRVAPDIVHTVTLKPVLYGGLAAQLTGVPAIVHAVSGLGYVFTSDGVRASTRRGLVLAAYKVALGHRNQRVIFQNADDRRELGRVVPDADVVYVRGSGVDLDAYAPVQRAVSQRVRVVLAARLLRDKGIFEFVEAARILKNDGVPVDLVLVGKTDEGNPASVPSSLVEKWSREGVVEWLGHRNDMPVVWRDADIACLPSYREGTPKSLVEAAACGLPIVTTDAPGCREVVQDGANGILVPVGDSVRLAGALRRLSADADLRLEMGHRSREIAIETFGIRAVVEATLGIYEDLGRRPRH